MMFRSREIHCWGALAIGLLLPTAGVVAASIPSQLFEKHSGNILSSGLLAAEGVLFATGRSTCRGSSAEAELAAERLAESAAEDRLLDWATNQIQWPKNLSRTIANRLWSSFRRVGMDRLELRGLQRIECRKTADGNFTAVVALPNYNGQIPSYQYQDVIRGLLEALKRGEKSMDVMAVMEICPSNDMQSAVALLAEKAAKDVGENAACTIRGTSLGSVRALKDVEPYTDPLRRERSLGILWAQLEARPYHPAVCFQLGNVLQEAGFRQAAGVLYSRGVDVWPNAPASHLCRSAAIDRLSSPTTRFIPEEFWPQIFEAAPRHSELLGHIGRLVVLSLGDLPTAVDTTENESLRQSRALFYQNPPDLNGSLTNALGSLSQNLTADGCNLTGRCLMLTERQVLAAPFFVQALRCEPNHPYAGGNLREAVEWLEGNRGNGNGRSQAKH